MDKGKLKKMIRDYGMENILGGGLAKILTALAENQGGGGGGSIVLACDLGDNYEVSLKRGSKSDVASMLGITEEDVDRLLNGEFAFLNVTSRKEGQTKLSGAPITSVAVGNSIEFIATKCDFRLRYTDGVYSGGCSIEWPK